MAVKNSYMNLLKAFVLSIYDFSRGSIWKIRENEWKEKLGEKYDQKSNVFGTRGFR